VNQDAQNMEFLVFENKMRKLAVTFNPIRFIPTRNKFSFSCTIWYKKMNNNITGGKKKNNGPNDAAAKKLAVTAPKKNYHHSDYYTL
jgi:hypothetical protein